MSGTTDHIRSTIEQDKQRHPHCSYSTIRSHFSSVLNGSSKAETLTKVVRACEGEALVEIYTQKNESDDNTGAHGETAMQHGFSHPQQLPPMFPLPGMGDRAGGQGGAVAEDMLSSLFGHMLEGVFQGFAGGNGRAGGGGGRGGFGNIFSGGFPFPVLPSDPYDCQQQQQHRKEPHCRMPRPPHSFPRGHHKADDPRSGSEGEVTEI